MVTKKPKGLGRGLEALLGPKVSETATDAENASSTANSPGLPASLRLSDMVAGQYQPRTRMDEGALYELAESIKVQGIHGQTVYVQPSTGMVMVLTSVWEQASGKQDPQPYEERDALWRGVLQSLGGDLAPQPATTN